MPTACRVLAADDDPTVRLLLGAALTPAGFALTAVDDGESAIAACCQDRFDLVLLDVEMAGMDGFAAAAEIRRVLGEGLPIILLSGRQDAAFHEQLAASTYGHLAKPVDWGRLAAYLRQYLAAP